MLAQYFFRYFRHVLAIKPCAESWPSGASLQFCDAGLLVVDSLDQCVSFLNDSTISKKSVVIFTQGLSPSPSMVQECEGLTPFLLMTELTASELACRLRQIMSDLHPVNGLGTVVNVHGLGVLIEGTAGVGKSDLALGLVDRGHVLIADDAPEWRCEGGGKIHAHCPVGFYGLLAIRGLGVIDVRRIYDNPSLFSPSSGIDLVVHLSDRSTMINSEIIDIQPQLGVLNDCILPWVVLAKADGRNMPLLLEVMVRQHQLMLQGYDTAY